MGSRPLLVVVSGLPATGKTRLARTLAQSLCLPLISKDDYKEILFDRLGAETPNLGPTSFELMWHTAEALLAARLSLVLETHFYHDPSTPRLRELCNRYKALPVQIHLKASLEVIQARAAARIASGERHAGHVDKLRFDMPLPPQAPLELGGPLLVLDTTDFSIFDVGLILAFVRAEQEAK